MADLLERTLLLGLGALTLTREKVKQAVNKLVEEGEVEAEEVPNIVDRLVERGEAEREELRKLVREELDKVRVELPLASRKDVEELSQKIDELAVKVEELASE